MNCAFGYRIAMSLVFALFFCLGCSAYPSNATNSNQPPTETDSVMRNAIGDSIYNIIIKAKKIKAEEIVLTNDTTNSVSSSKAIDVKGKLVPLVQFILSNPQNYGGDMAVYGMFLPCFKLTFINKKESCILNFDFGLKKWNICDDKGQVIKKFDFPSDDMLRLANMLFPQNELYKKQINAEKR